MRAWCVVVPRERGEEIRRILDERGLLLKHLRIAHDGTHLLLPTLRRVDFGFPAREAEFDVGYVPIRSYKDVVEVPPSLRRSLPSSFDVVGDVAVIKIPEELRPYREAIGRAILRWNPKIRTAVEDHGVKGEHRVRKIEILAGEARTTTIHVEHGLRYRVDLARAYFSPRLATERARVANLVREDEVVADPFAGVGPYAILIARRRKPRRVHASDANAAAVDLLRLNVAANRADRVGVRHGDARTILPQIRPVDRVILDLPHSAIEFLPNALAALQSGGTVHLYRILKRAEEEETMQVIKAIAHEAGFRITNLGSHPVRAYSPTQHHIAFDVTVDRTSRPSVLGTSRTGGRTSPRRGSRESRKQPGRIVPRAESRGPRTTH